MWVSENCISFTKSTSKTKSHISSPQQKLEDRDFVLYCWESLVIGSQKIPLQKDGYWSKRGLVANLAPTFWGPWYLARVQWVSGGFGGFCSQDTEILVHLIVLENIRNATGNVELPCSLASP